MGRTFTFSEATWAALFLALIGFFLGTHFMIWVHDREAARRALEPKLVPLSEFRKGTEFTQWDCNPRQRAEYLEVCKQRIRSGATRGANVE